MFAEVKDTFQLLVFPTLEGPLVPELANPDPHLDAIQAVTDLIDSVPTPFGLILDAVPILH
jgi:hypothetical protein